MPQHSLDGADRANFRAVKRLKSDSLGMKIIMETDAPAITGSDFKRKSV